MTKVLVYGWYHQGNIGDDLFIEAFQHLFPNYEFIFTDTISLSKLTDIDAVFFGGGSFLSGRPQIDEDAMSALLLDKKIFYLGVGVENVIHPNHKLLMVNAQMVATRSPDQAEILRSFCKKVRIIPDLVYSLQDKIKPALRQSRSVLIMTNLSVVPDRTDPHWKHASWNYFKSEFTQFLDWLVTNKYHLTFFPMCTGVEIDDRWASSEIVSHMEHRNSKYLHYINPIGIEQITQFVSSHKVLITQRFHGIVLAEMTRTPYIAIHHHDKLKTAQPGEGEFLSYYHSAKQSYIDSFVRAMTMDFVKSMPIESTIFETFVEEVASLI